MTEKILNNEAVLHDERNFVFILRVTYMILLVTLAISWRLYASADYRATAMAPLIEGLQTLPHWTSWAVLSVAVVSLLTLMARPLNSIALAVFLSCSIFWVLQDVCRLNPFMCMYNFPLFVALVSKYRSDRALDALRIMVCGVYFWAGFHKLNLSFYDIVFPWFIQPIYKISLKDPGILDHLFTFALIITPLFEAAIGVLLLFPKWRRLATLMAFTMLVTVLFCLGPLGHNWGVVVWPWNIYLFAIEFKLFFATKYDREERFLLKRVSGITSVAALIYILAPMLAIYTHWYSYPGFKLYSGNIVRAQILLPQDETLKNAPAHTRELIGQERVVDVFKWSGFELGNGIYPSPYALQRASKGLCRFLDKPKEAILRINYPPPFYSLKLEPKEMALCDE